MDIKIIVKYLVKLGTDIKHQIFLKLNEKKKEKIK